MEKRIREYERFITEKIKQGHIDDKLISFHQDTVNNFQHERLVHLLIMLFFIFITLIMTSVCIWWANDIAWNNWISLLPAAIVTIILWALSIAYVKHYYFLENHIQELYDISKKLYKYTK